MIDIEGLPPPHDLDSEVSVISSIMIDDTLLPQVLDVISPTDMYSNSHRRIMESIVSLCEKGVRVDIVTLATELKECGRLAEVNGVSYLTSILNSSPHVANVVEYAKAVKRFSSARAMIKQCQLTASKLYLLRDGIDEVLESHSQAISDMEMSRGGSVELKPIKDSVSRSIKDHAAFAASGKSIRGYSTGFPVLDKRTGGCNPTDFTIIAGRPGMGKTAGAMSLAINVAKQGLAVLVFSLEMPDVQLADRAVSGEAGKSLNVFRNRIRDEDAIALSNAVSLIGNLPIYITDKCNLDIGTICATVRNKQAELSKVGLTVGLVIVDHLGLIRMPKADRHDLAVGEITKQMKQAAKEFKVPWVTLCQLSRSCESRDDKRPMLSDLRDSGNIEQDADNVWMFYRDEYYNKKSSDRGIVEVGVAKQRNGGVGIVRLAFDAKSTTFRNLEGYEDE
jgi:replicative DNA helicase